MKFKYIFLLALAMLVPGLLPAPDLPPDGNPFLLLDKMRNDIIKKDKSQYRVRYFRFKKLLAKYESANNWKEYNQFGFIGKYQFGQSALDATGYGHITFENFKLNPASFPEQDQEKAMDILLKINESVMGKSIDKFVGLIFFDSIPLTRMGILAAAHLAGPANVREFLESFGERNFKDKMGTRISDYVYRFSR